MKERFYSLDVFRGATVALMIMVNNPGSWTHIYAPLDHAKWVGCTPTDLVFPFFLFVVGNAMAFVIPRLREAGSTAFLKKVIKRSILIFAIGLFLNWCPFVEWHNNVLVFKPWHEVRIFGVLQRIAVAYLFASLIVYFFKRKTTIIISLILLLGYWWLCYALGTAGDPYSLQGWFGTRMVDMKIIGANHMYRGEGVVFDPEGIASSLAPIVQVIIGYLTGMFIREKGKSYEMVTKLFVTAAILLFIGAFGGQFFPISKKIWTSTFVIYSSGMAMLILSVIIYFIELQHKHTLLDRFFNVFGKNPLFIFFLSGFLPRVIWLIRIPNGTANGQQNFINPLSWFYENVCKPVFSNENNSSLMYALCFIVFMWVIVYFMDKKKIYIKV
ncbi:MAG TPA: heparan-alpha-glucosaminide N-acetyltransferase domain-containing protein [Arachidicoccus soli]|nr:heparan-alpha-glucosaminide N-acetyltransferase domain-containing protein [Arachidicoccus soli]